MSKGAPSDADLERLKQEYNTPEKREALLLERLKDPKRNFEIHGFLETFYIKPLHEAESNYEHLRLESIINSKADALILEANKTPQFISKIVKNFIAEHEKEQKAREALIKEADADRAKFAELKRQEQLKKEAEEKATRNRALKEKEEARKKDILEKSKYHGRIPDYVVETQPEKGGFESYSPVFDPNSPDPKEAKSLAEILLRRNSAPAISAHEKKNLSAGSPLGKRHKPHSVSAPDISNLGQLQNQDKLNEIRSAIPTPPLEPIPERKRENSKPSIAKVPENPDDSDDDIGDEQWFDPLEAPEDTPIPHDKLKNPGSVLAEQSQVAAPAAKGQKSGLKPNEPEIDVHDFIGAIVTRGIAEREKKKAEDAAPPSERKESTPPQGRDSPSMPAKKPEVDQNFTHDFLWAIAMRGRKENKIKEDLLKEAKSVTDEDIAKATKTAAEAVGPTTKAIKEAMKKGSFANHSELLEYQALDSDERFVNLIKAARKSGPASNGSPFSLPLSQNSSLSGKLTPRDGHKPPSPSGDSLFRS